MDSSIAKSLLAAAQLTILSAAKEQRQVMLRIADAGDKRNVMQMVSDKQ